LPVLGATLAAFQQVTKDTLVGRVSAALTSRVPSIGAVEQSKSEISLQGGAIRLSVTERAGPENGMHVHITDMKGGFAACVLGAGVNRSESETQVATIYSGNAFPVLWSHTHGEPLLGARRFVGSEPWGVAGHRGFVGPILGRGSAEDSTNLDEAALFGVLPGLPRDGKPHYLKAVLWRPPQGWLRTIELDGDAKLVTAEPWKSSVQPKASMLIAWAVVEAPDAESDHEARTGAMRRLSERPAWLTIDAGRCPADVLPSSFSPSGYDKATCSGGRLRDCLRECEQGSSGSCYHVALESQAERLDQAVLETLFVRACRLGNPSACTNAAAGRTRFANAYDKCSVQTFRQICELAGDPWACTMTASELSKGHHASDRARIRDLADAGCRYGPSDRACRAAIEVLESVERAK
jgi:hypothetical protein